MLLRFLEQQPAICAALLSGEVRKTEKEVCTLSEADITSAEEIVNALKPMKVATLVMSEESSPTISVVAPLHAQLIHDLQESSSDSTMTKEIKSAICLDFSKRYLDDEQKEILYMASAIDPRFKALPFLSEDKRQDIYVRVIAEAARSQQRETDADIVPLPNVEDIPVQEDISAGPSKRPRDSFTLADLLGQTYGGAVRPSHKKKNTHDQAEEEMTRYKEAAPMPLAGANPLDWWKQHQSEYPLLSHLAKRYLCIPGTSVSSERVFSTAGDIITTQRSALSPEHVDEILFLNKNLKIK
ncbi:unnamed protein product [Leuciscus chuanchicus]